MLGHLVGTLVPQLTEKQPRQGLQAFPFLLPDPTQLFTAWLAVDSCGGQPCRRLHPQGKNQVWPERAARLLPLRSPGSRRAVRLSAFVCLMSLCSFYMCCCCSLSLLTPCPPLHPPISQLQAPIFQPGAGEAAQRGQTSPHTQGVCPALPCVLSSV